MSQWTKYSAYNILCCVQLSAEPDDGTAILCTILIQCVDFEYILHLGFHYSRLTWNNWNGYGRNVVAQNE